MNAHTSKFLRTAVISIAVSLACVRILLGALEVSVRRRPRLFIDCEETTSAHARDLIEEHDQTCYDWPGGGYW